MADLRSFEEIRLDTRAGRIALLHWPSEQSGAPRVLCLHGWLDNAASFIPLAQHLEGLDLYALDFPGHGHSDHRPQGVRYAFTEYLFDLDAVLDALGWAQARLMGHSLGGGVSCAYASAAPERVKSICVLDGLGGYTVPEAETPRQIRRGLDWLRRPRRALRQYESLEAMARSREEDGFLTITGEAARLISERAARRVEDEEGVHYIWRTDPALRWNTPVMLSEPQVLACLGEIQAPVLSFHAQPWTFEHLEDRIGRRQATLSRGTFRDVEGNHHFHMDEAARIAPEIEAFFRENE